jgi:hypothetical protein
MNNKRNSHSQEVYRYDLLFEREMITIEEDRHEQQTVLILWHVHSSYWNHCLRAICSLIPNRSLIPIADRSLADSNFSKFRVAHRLMAVESFFQVALGH